MLSLSLVHLASFKVLELEQQRVLQIHPNAFVSLLKVYGVLYLSISIYTYWYGTSLHYASFQVLASFCDLKMLLLLT